MPKFYALTLTKPGANISRYALYTVDKKGDLVCIWPEDSHKEKATLWPAQVFYPLRDNGPNKFPAYHFKVGNIGYNKIQYLKDEIQKVFSDPVEIFTISGWSPSSR